MPPTVYSPKFTEKFRQRELEKGRRSLFYFGFAILGFTASDPATGESQIDDLHIDLCHFLEGRRPHHPWRRGMVCVFRGAAKSVWSTQAYPLWRGLYIPNFSTKIIENSADNAKRNHFMPIVDLLMTSPRADYLQWLFEHRIPPGFAGTNSEQLKFVQTDPLANPALSYWGLESKFEGAHPDLVILDDPEGADAAKSALASAEAWRTYQQTIPLLKHPTRSQILVVLTPHGDDPMAWKIRDREGWTGVEDNERTEFKIFWQPVVKGDGKSAWPARFPDEYIESLRKEDIFDQQYMLRRTTSKLSLFDMSVVVGDDNNPTGSCYEPIPARQAVSYPGYLYDPEIAKLPGYVQPRAKLTVAELSKLRTYLHFDPLHRALNARRSALNKQRPADAAIVAVGVNRDFHVLALEGWSENADIDTQLLKLFTLYLKWRPMVVTYEGVGAQHWIHSMVVNYEKTYEHWRRPVSSDFLGYPVPLPRLSARLVEADKTNESKEWVYREVLSSWVNRGVLHFNRKHEQFIYQLDHVLDRSVAVDLVDCLAQGPAVWAPPILADAASKAYHEHVAKVNKTLAGGVDRVAGWAKRTGYSPPWRR